MNMGAQTSSFQQSGGCRNKETRKAVEGWKGNRKIANEAVVLDGKAVISDRKSIWFGNVEMSEVTSCSSWDITMGLTKPLTTNTTHHMLHSMK
jgi:hypothetical protein